jgi:hypothetical protein
MAERALASRGCHAQYPRAETPSMRHMVAAECAARTVIAETTC